MIALPGLSLVPLLLGAVAAISGIPDECSRLKIGDPEACQQPMDHVVAVAPDSYAAKIQCIDCPSYNWGGKEMALAFGGFDLVGAHMRGSRPERGPWLTSSSCSTSRWRMTSAAFS
jgi:hypothetical protein